MKLINYIDRSGRDRFQEWFDGLRDTIGRIAIQRRIDRLWGDNVGDCKFCRDGVWELRIDQGPGYRIYYAQTGKHLVLLLLGGDKRQQDADIEKAIKFWQDFQRRQK